MSEFVPTASQKEAICNRGGALLVSAAAGSGKTRVLTERLMQRITDPESPVGLDRFLVITYTRAAAAELRSKISEQLALAVSEHPEIPALRRQSALVSRAHIDTIHGFCTYILRENCHLLGLPPSFSVADSETASAILETSLEHVLDSAYEAENPDFLQLTDTIGAGKDDRNLRTLVLNMYKSMQSHARPEKWAEEQIALLSERYADAGDTVWGRELLDRTAEEANYWVDEFAYLLRLISDGGYWDILEKYGANLSETQDSLLRLAEASALGWEHARSALPVIFSRLPTLRSPSSPELADYIKQRRNDCKKSVAALDFVFDAASEKSLSEVYATAPAMTALLRLILELDREYSARKQKRSLLDFSDLEHFAARLLTDENGEPGELAFDISQRFEEVMVDEYQDVSPVQELIVRSLTRDEENLFVVGDVKQSIYSFRLADPGIFTDRYNTSKSADTALPGERRRVLLSENFRSRPEILDCVNIVFEAIMSEKLGGIRYDSDVELKAGRSLEHPAPIPELIGVRIPEDDESAPNKTEAEAMFVAQKILALVKGENEIFEGGDKRRIGFGDIAILLRNSKSSSGIYKKELQKLGIPVSSSDSVSGFFDTPEVSTVLSLLSVVDNPHQDVPLIAALCSPLFGFSADDISEIRLADRKSDFFDAVVKAAESSPVCRSFLDKLEAFRLMARDMEVSLLLRKIYDELNCLALAVAGGGDEARLNLMQLFELADSFEQSGWRGLHRFVFYLNSMRENGKEPPSSPAGSAGSVRITTVHRSKGLQFPVVFYCDTGREFNMTDLSAPVLMHPELGLGSDFIDIGRGLKFPTLAKAAISKRKAVEALSEEMRVMYVAMTRAMERLYITFALGKRSLEISEFEKNRELTLFDLLRKKSVADWLLAVRLVWKMKDDRHYLHLYSADPASVTLTDMTDTEQGTEDVHDDCRNISDLSALSWQYPYEASVGMPSKVTATELKDLLSAAVDSEDVPAAIYPAADIEFRRPLLDDAAPLSAADRGTAAHTALRYIDYARCGSVEEISLELKRLALEGRLSAEEAAACDASDIFAFFSSDLGVRVKNAKGVLREFPFSLLIPASEFFPESVAGDETLVLQGRLDLVIEEEGGLTIIDYKTDRISASAVPERAERYRDQLMAYSAAISRITGKPVLSCVLYFLSPGIAHEIHV